MEHPLSILVGPELQVGSAGSCHRTLAFLGKGAPPGKATSDEIPERVIARIRLKGRLSTNDQTGKIEVRAVEDLVLIQDDRIDGDVALDAPSELPDSRIITYRKYACQRVKWNDRGGNGASSSRRALPSDGASTAFFSTAPVPIEAILLSLGGPLRHLTDH